MHIPCRIKCGEHQSLVLIQHLFCTDREGNVYVVDAAFGNFQVFNSDGELLMFVGDRSERDGPAKYMLPSGIAVDEDGRIYVVDQWFRKIDVYRPVGLTTSSGFLARRAAPPPR